MVMVGMVVRVMVGMVFMVRVGMVFRVRTLAKCFPSKTRK